MSDRSPWRLPTLTALPKLTALTLASAIGGGGGTSGGGSTVFSFLLALALMAGVGACRDDREEGGTPVDPAAISSQALTCQVDVQGGRIDCQGPSAVGGEVTLGGQGTRIALRSTGVAYDAITDTFSAAVTIQNLLSQTLGLTTYDAGSTGIFVFFVAEPTVTSGTGTVTVANPSGHGDFTGVNQPYFLYSDTLSPGRVSSPLTWKWEVPGTVNNFTFSVLVYAGLPDPDGVFFWLPVPQFSSDQLIDIAVNSATDAMAVGSNSAVLRKVGTEWSYQPGRQVGIPWAGVAAIGGGRYVGATVTGGVYLFDGKVWNKIRDTGYPISGMTAHAADRIAVGGFGNVDWLGSNGWQHALLGAENYRFFGSFGADVGVVMSEEGSEIIFNYNSTTLPGGTFDPFPRTTLYAGQGRGFGHATYFGQSRIFRSGAGIIYGPAADSVVDALEHGVSGLDLWAAIRDNSTGGSRLMSFLGGVWGNATLLPARVTRMVQDSAGGMYLLSADGIRRWNGSSVIDELVASPSDTPTVMNVVTDTVVVGTAQGRVWTYVDGAWSVADPDPGSTDPIAVLSPRGAGPVATIQGNVVRPSTTGPIDLGTPVTTAWITPDGDFVIAATGVPAGFGYIYRFSSAGGFLSGPDFNPGGGPNVQLTRIWGESIDDFWVLGKGGKLLHYASSTYNLVPLGTTEDLVSIAGTGPDDIWVGGTNGFLAHWDGSVWNSCSLSTTQSIDAIWSAGADRVYVAFALPDSLAFSPCDAEVITVAGATAPIRSLQGPDIDHLYALAGPKLFHGRQ